MGRYPTFAVGEYFDILSSLYGFSPDKISLRTGIQPEAISVRDVSRYPNDRHVLNAIRLLDELGYYSNHQLTTGDNARRALLALQQPNTAMKLTIAELRSAANVSDFLECAVHRLGALANNHRLWLEKTETKIKLCHTWVYEEENFSGPQRIFLFLVTMMRSLFPLQAQDIQVTFPYFGIRDLENFTHRTQCMVELRDAFSSVELNISNSQLANPLFNQLARKAITEALDDLLKEINNSSITDAVEKILKKSILQNSGSLDIKAVSEILEVSRATLHRKLKEEGSSFKEIRSRTRLTHAAFLLRSTALGLSEISSILGYSEPSAFSRAFKSKNGINPIEYRSQSN